MSGVLTEEDVLESLDFEATIECELRSDECVSKATVLVVCRRCRAGAAMCDPCINHQLRGFWSAKLRLGRLVEARCNRCGFHDEKLSKVFAILPLRAGA